MRIQNNITAMNTHRMYTINNDNVAKSAEKLSSGYRINRAGDDAAGLAISEKMRSQIRGLNMATKNSQDAISLVQTAEGALQETQNMLQRMNELAVQAATGTNEDLDRTALGKEFEQLKKEINDIAEQTTFNNMKVLDGSLSYNGYTRSAATAGINATIETSEATATNPVTKGDVAEAAMGNDFTGGTAKISGLKDVFSVTSAQLGDGKVTLDFGAAGKVEVTKGGSANQFNLTVSGAASATATSKTNVGGASLGAALVDTTSGLSVVLGLAATDTDVTINAANGTIDFANKGALSGKSSGNVLPDSVAASFSQTGTAKASELTITTRTDGDAFTAEAKSGTGDALGATGIKGVEYEIEIALGKANAGDLGKGTVKVTADGTTSLAELLAKESKSFSIGGHDGFQFLKNGTKIELHHDDPVTLGDNPVDAKTEITIKAASMPIATDAALTATDEVVAKNSSAATQEYKINLWKDPGTKPAESDYASRGAYLEAKEKYDNAVASNQSALKNGQSIKYGDKTYTYKTDGTADKTKGEFGSLSELEHSAE